MGTACGFGTRQDRRRRISNQVLILKYLFGRAPAPVKSKRMPPSTKSNWQLGFPCAFLVWAAVVLAGALEGMRRGFHGHAFVIALGVAAVLFGFELFLAAPRVLVWAQRALGGRAAYLSPLVPLFAVLVYSLSVSGSWAAALVGAAYCVLPAILLASSAGKSPGTWEDYAALMLIWVPAVLPVPVRLLYRVFPYPPPLTHTLAILLALSTAVVAFVLLRRLDGIGYAIAWGRGFTANFALHFAIFAAIAIPLGITLGFLKYQPSLERTRSSPLTVLGILFFTAWPEEFLFRGLLQNLLSRAMKNQWVGLIVASIVFGFSHIFHAPFPNWRYVLLATIAGLFYGHCWIRTRSLLPGALVHALVDISWHILFR
jgi:membrane protease YdiL (CAAX protease family)